ncbi:hypothetical protein ACFP3H_15790 [Nocardia lasii]|uniref:Uncharacterized protein n=1 Tax=Nocardia lasii TaxID=1616107 RepID=A0ABW1JV60_9NOCA
MPDAEPPVGVPAGCAIDRWADEAAILLRAERRGSGPVLVRCGARKRVVLDVRFDEFDSAAGNSGSAIEADDVPLMIGDRRRSHGLRPAVSGTSGHLDPERDPDRPDSGEYANSVARPSARIVRDRLGGGVSALPVLPDAATWALPDLELLRTGTITIDRLHPLVAAALEPCSALGPDVVGRPGVVLEPGVVGRPGVALGPGTKGQPGVVLEPGVVGQPGAALEPGAVRDGVVGAAGQGARVVGRGDSVPLITAGQRLVLCRGERHRIGLVKGVLAALDHDPAEIRREELLVALTGTPLPCLQVIDHLHRHPDDLAGVRERLDHGDLAGALTVVEELLGPDAVLRDGPLRDALETVLHQRITYSLFRANLPAPGHAHLPPAYRSRHITRVRELARAHPRHATHR